MGSLMLETALSERDVAALHEWQEQQRKRVAELEVALDFERSEVARLINLLIEAQANGNHYKRAVRHACLLSLPFGTEREVEERYEAALAATKEAPDGHDAAAGG